MKNIYLFILLIHYNAIGQISKNDTVKYTILDEVLVTTKNNLKVINTPRTVDVITMNTLKTAGNNTLHQALNTISGVYMVDMGNEQHAMSIRLPINYSPLYNYLESGIPIRPVGIFNNNALLELNRFSLQKIELIKGTFSGSFGAQSIGASVNFIQNNYDNTINEISLQSNGYGQFEAVVQHKIKLSTKTNMSYNINHVQRKVDEILHFNYTKQSASIRVENNANENNKLIFQSNFINYIGDQKDGYSKEDFENRNLASYDRFSNRKTKTLRNTLEWKHKFNSSNNLSITAFNRVISEEQNPFYAISYVSPYLGRITNDRFTSVGLSTNFNSVSTNKKFKLNTALYIDATPNNMYKANLIYVNKLNSVNQSFVATDSFLTNYKANILNVAISSSLTYMPTNKLFFTLGLRADKLQYNFTNYLPVSANAGAPSGFYKIIALNPEIGLLYKFNNNQTIFTQYSSGYTPPTLSKLYRDNIKELSLKSAKYYTTEIGYKLFLGKTNFQLSVYNMKGVDEFISLITPNGVEEVNAGKTSHKGIELKYSYSHKKIQFNYNSTYSKHVFKKYSAIDWNTFTQINYDNNLMNGAPSYLHYANVMYSITKKYSTKLIIEWNKMGPYKINASNTLAYNGFDIFNLKSTFLVKKMLINIGVNNIFNKIYATNADGTYGVRYYPGLPRTLQVGCSYRF
jgi:iron complex outermembrane recepter protein